VAIVDKIFYAKPAEAKSISFELPEIWTDKHVLRNEIRYRCRLHKQLKEAEVKARSLYEEPLYIRLLN